MVKGLILSIICLYISSPVHVMAEQFRLVALDLGEGQSILLQRANKGFLLDTGHFGNSERLLKQLALYGVDEIEGVILTHLDGDHASGIFSIKQRFPQAMIYESGHRIGFHPFLDAYRWVAEKLDDGTWQVKKVARGSTISWKGVLFSFLWPVEPLKGDIPNYNSLVTYVTYGEAQILAMGDADKKIESILAAEKVLPQKIDVLVVGHHGASDSTDEYALSLLQPEYSVISVNENNLKGYPAEETLKLIERSGTKLHITGRDGDFVWNHKRAPSEEQ